MVLLHPAVLNRRACADVALVLSSAYRVIAPDLPGHGASAEGKFTLDAASRLIAECVESNGGRALVAGDSLGGYCALHFAARHPDLVAGVVAAGCTLNPVGIVALSLRARAILNRVMSLMGGAAERELELLRRAYPDRRLDDIIAAGLAPRARADGLEACAFTDFVRLAAGISSPVLYVNSESDAAARRDESAFLRATARASVETIRGRAHGVSLDNSGAFASAIERFADRSGWRGHTG